jgi:heme/copper-type cytochrome/quinol oxidase subunit 1
VPAAGNPWGSRGLEWQTPSPPPAHNFVAVPVVLSGPYEYGESGGPPVADMNPPVGVLTAALAGPEAGSDAARAEA